MPHLTGWTKPAWFSVGVCLIALVIGPAARAQEKDVPAYKVDPFWPKQLPNNWILGAVGDMAVDKDNHIWVLHRPGSNSKEDYGLQEGVAICCSPAPPVLVFDVQGNLIKSWGGPGAGYDWPTTEHGITVDQAGNVWITGSNAKDRQVVKFTNDGKILLQIGKSSNAPMNNSDTTMLGGAASIEVDENAHEVYIADGYMNRRIAVFDSENGAFKRMWGAYGKPPNDAKITPYNPKEPPIDSFRNPVHCVHLSTDGLVYVCDRSANRIQVFAKEGKFLKEFFARRETVGQGSVYDLEFPNDPGQKYLLVADGQDDVIWILRRSDGAMVGSFGHRGHNAGEFYHVHNIDSDSNGNLYMGEVNFGKRIMKFSLVK